MTHALTCDFSAASGLFVKAFPLPAPQRPGAEKPATIFFGTGLSTSGALSEGLPFDFMSMPIAAEMLRRQEADPSKVRILHYIPDVTALQNAFADADAVTRLAERMEKEARNIARHLGLKDNYIVLRGSEIEKNPLRQSLLGQTCAYAQGVDIPDKFKGYLAEQLADMAFFKSEYGATTKISWTMARNPAAAARGLDETFFDAHYQKCFGQDIQFAYIQPGRALSKEAGRACPYTHAPGDHRLPLRHTFNTAAHIAAAGIEAHGDTVKDALKYWTIIAGGLETLFGVSGLPEKPQALNQKHSAEDSKRFWNATMARVDGARLAVHAMLIP